MSTGWSLAEAQACGEGGVVGRAPDILGGLESGLHSVQEGPERGPRSPSSCSALPACGTRPAHLGKPCPGHVKTPALGAFGRPSQGRAGLGLQCVHLSTGALRRTGDVTGGLAGGLLCPERGCSGR